MTETDPLKSFLHDFPLTERWLDDIVRVLLERSNGTAHVRDIAKELWGQHKLRTMEATVTRRVNDFCSDAYDFNKAKAFDLFEKIEPATYRLRSFPQKPDILELIRIKFEDPIMNSMWNEFCEIAKKQKPDIWAIRTNNQKLTAFAKWMVPGGKPFQEYEQGKESVKLLGDLD